MPEGQDAALILANHFALEILFYGALAIGLTVPTFRHAYLRCKFVFDRAAAAMLGTLALRIVTDR